MPTRGDLKAEIADDLSRSDLTSQIGSAIAYAIRRHRTRPFWWTKDRAQTFQTVADQASYTASDLAALDDLFRLTRVLVNYGDSLFALQPRNQAEIEASVAEASATLPEYYSFYDGALWLAPKPDDAYTVRLLGDFIEAAPASDSEAGNRWMNEAYNLIRAEAKRYLAKHVMRDRSLDEDMQQEAERELILLIKESDRRTATGLIEPDQEYRPASYAWYWQRYDGYTP